MNHSGASIKIVISPIGKPVIDVTGATGTSCKDLTRPIEDALTGGTGDSVTTDKPEMYMQDTTSQHEEV